jgi:WS/DGAT/MGAT family acyltransferase
MMLGVSRRWPQDIGALLILDGASLFDSAGRLEIERIRQGIRARLHLVPRFRQLTYDPGGFLGGPLWVDDRQFDLIEHVREQPLPAPGGELELLDAVEQLRKRPLDPARPLWEMWFLTGLPDQRVALFVRIHHSIADGMAAMTTVATFLDNTPDTPVVSPMPWIPRPWPSTRGLLIENMGNRLRGLARAVSVMIRPRAALHRFRESWPALRELVSEKPGSETSLTRMVGPDRHFRLIRSSLEDVKRAGRAHGATVNDLLLTVTAGGVRALLQSRGEPVAETTIRVYSPVSLRRQLGGSGQGNLIAQMAVPLHVGEPDPVRRLRQISSETSRRKAMTRTNIGVLVHNRILRRLTLMAATRQRVNVTTASIPGPSMTLYLAGARILEVFPLVPIMADEPLGVGAVSYAGELNIGVVADRDALPDIEVLTAGIGAELQALQSADHHSLDQVITSTERTTR